jgi:Transposase, Mutator family
VGRALNCLTKAFTCQLHKLRNVGDWLPDVLASTVAKCMRAAYRNSDALLAEAELQTLARKLDRSHPGAAASLREDLAETLTSPGWACHRPWRARCGPPTPSSR